MHLTENTISRECIFILGMHRSGTSATTGCMEIVGFNLGKHFFKPAEDNEKGYFENKKINYFNTELLALLHARWHDTYHLPPNWWKDPGLIVKRKKLITIFAEEFGDSKIISIKDPRISVVLPFYFEVFSELNITPKFIINFRNPFEVAASLEKRNNFSLAKSLLLWMDHTLKAELFSRNYARVFLDYGSLVKKPVEAMQQINKSLDIGLTINNKKVELLNAFVEKRLKHHSLPANSKNQDIPKMILQLHRILRSIDLKERVAEKQLQQFDKISDDYYKSVKFFAGIDEVQKLKIRIVESTAKHEQTTFHIQSGQQRIEYVLNSNKKVSEFWIYPLNNFGAAVVKNLKLQNKKGEPVRYKQFENTADWKVRNGWMLFETESPLIKYKLNQPIEISKISFRVETVSYADFSFRIGIQELLNQTSKLQEQIKISRSDLRKLIIKNKNHVKDVEAEGGKMIAGHMDLMKTIQAKHGNEIKKLKTAHQQTLQKLEVEKTTMIQTYEEDINKLKVAKQQLVNSHKEEKDKLKSEQAQILVLHNQELQKLRGKQQQQDESYQEKVHQLVQSHTNELKQKESERRRLENNHKKLITRLNREKQRTIEKIEIENKKLNKEINEKAELLNTILNSNSWKIGRTITKPVRFFKEKTQQ